MTKDKAVFGIYTTKSAVETAVEELKAAGFERDDVSVLMSENVSTKEFAMEKKTKMPEDASRGGGAGIVIGGVLGWLVGIGALAIPGAGPIIAAGPIFAALAGAGAGGIIGGIAGALIGMGVPEYEAKRYEGLINEGGILLSVHSENSEETKKAKEILEHTGAQNIATAGLSKAKHGKKEIVEVKEKERKQSKEEVDRIEKDHAVAEKERALSEKKRIEAEKERAESEKERALSEKKRIEAEKERAESEAERIRLEKEKAESEAEKIRLEKGVTVPVTSEET